MSTDGTDGSEATAEIERRFLVEDLDAVPPAASAATLWQGYLAMATDCNVRIRRQAEADGEVVLTLTVKRLAEPGVLLHRVEVEIPITAEQLATLRPGVLHRPVEKTRHRVPLDDGVGPGGLVAEVDVFEGHLAGLVIAEVEFASVAASRAFTPRPWMGAEVTEDGRYVNSELARVGLPGGPPGAA